MLRQRRLNGRITAFKGGETMIFLDEIKSEVSKISKQIIEMGNSL
jgi:hypothetical protein